MPQYNALRSQRQDRTADHIPHPPAAEEVEGRESRNTRAPPSMPLSPKLGLQVRRGPIKRASAFHVGKTTSAKGTKTLLCSQGSQTTLNYEDTVTSDF